MKNQSQISAGGAIDYNVLFNLSDHPQCVLNSLGFIEALNHKFAEESGIGEAELLSVSFTNVFHHDDADKINQVLLTADQDRVFEFEARLLCSDQFCTTFFWKATLSGGNLYLMGKKSDNHIRPGHGFVTPTLTSDSVLLEMTMPQAEASTQNEHRFKTLVQNGTDLLAILSVEGKYKYVSPTVKKILGFDPEYYLGKSAFSFVHPDDVGRLLPLFESILHNIKIDIPAYRFISSDGKWHWLETVATNLLHDPTINGIVVNSRDITLHKEMESDILRNSRKFSNLIEQNKDGSFILNKDWRFTFLNSVIRNTPDLPKGLTVGVNIWKLMPNAVNTAFYSEFHRAFAENTPVHFKEFSPLFNKWFEVNAYPFEDSLTVMVRDITEQKIQQLTLSLEKEVLEMSAASIYNLHQLTDHLISGFEKIHTSLQASLSIVDKETNKLVPLSVPSMTGICNIDGDGVQIEAGCGPCALAALNHAEVYVSDILTDEIVANLRDSLQEHRITSTLSLPVINKNEEVLAVFTLYNSGHRHLLKTGTELIRRVGTIIQLLLENNQAKKDIELSNERYKLTIQATSDSIWDLDLKSQKLYRGNGFHKYFDQQQGFEPIELRKWEHNIHPEDTERVESSLERALANSSTNKWLSEYRYLKKDGTYAWVIDKGFIVRDKEKQAIRIVGAVQDISEIRKSQEKLIQSEENYKNLFFNNPTPMWTYDMQSEHFTMVNAAALALYGYTEEEFLQLDLFSIRIEEEHERLRKHMKSEAFLADRNVANEWTHLRKDKSAMIVDVVSHAVLINGRKSRLVAITDITDKKKDRQEILAQNRRLREIAQISSHETRKPLASILGLVNLFDKENLSNPLNKEIIQYLNVTANELDKVIHNIVRKTWLENETSSGFPE